MKRVEDRIEQKYQSLTLKESLAAIMRLSEPPARPNAHGELSSDLKASLEAIIGEPRRQTQLDIDRQAIWGMKARAGTAYVLGFLDAKLLMGIETLFAGIVVGYIQMFNMSRRRAPLSAHRIFENDTEALSFHQKIDELRNKQYAHKEMIEGQHVLSYCLTDEGDVRIDADGTHQNTHFHLSMCGDLYHCIAVVLTYLEEEIASESKKLVEGLSKEQKQFLRGYWVAAKNAALPDPIYEVIKRA